MIAKRSTLARLGALTFAFAAATALQLAPATARAADKDEAQALVDKARPTLTSMVGDKNYGALKAGLKTAKAVLIFPQVLKAGFFLGGSGGTGVLLVRGDSGEWSEPAFYTMGSVSFGLQFGGDAAEVVMLVNSQKGLDTLYASSLKLGGDASISAGPVGAGASGDVTTDFVSYSRSKGAFIGMSFSGSVLDVRDSLNNAYYGKTVRPIDIVVKKEVSNKGSAALRGAVKAAAK